MVIKFRVVMSRVSRYVSTARTTSGADRVGRWGGYPSRGRAYCIRTQQRPFGTRRTAKKARCGSGIRA